MVQRAPLPNPEKPKPKRMRLRGLPVAPPTRRRTVPLARRAGRDVPDAGRDAPPDRTAAARLEEDAHSVERPSTPSATAS